MSILGRLAQNDLERLSAYVDGALPAREQAWIEERLKADAELRQALAEVRSVKVALGGLPQRRLPRNFTLREADLGRRRWSVAFPYLRFASIVASGLFVLTTAVRSFSLPTLPMASAPQFASEVQGELEAANAGTPEVMGELRAEAPAAAAAPEEGLSDSLAAVLTETPAATDCPACPTSLTTAKAEMGQALDEVAGQPGRQTAATGPLVAVQWLFGLVAIFLGVLAVRARRS